MSWRSIQLSNNLCAQDRLILDLFGDTPVVLVGNDLEFSKLLNQQPDADSLILVVNTNVWASDIVDIVTGNINAKRYQSFYVSINRYMILGNDTTMEFPDSNGSTIVSWLTKICDACGYQVTKSGHNDSDKGKHFNFVQPLTWIYGNTQSNQSN